MSSPHTETLFPLPITITSPTHLQALLASTKYLIADFHAEWCPPCKSIAPLYDALSAAHSNPGEVVFVKVNVDQQQKIAAMYGVGAMPTFLVFRDGEVVESIRGANSLVLKGVVGGILRGGEDVVGKEMDTVKGKGEEKGKGNAKVDEEQASDSRSGSSSAASGYGCKTTL